MGGLPDIDTSDLNLTENDTQDLETQEFEENADIPDGEEPDADADIATEDELELESRSRFKFQGRELTPDELAQELQELQTLKSSSESYAKEKQFYDNLAADLGHVVRNPALAQKFRETYPAKFHSYLNAVTASMQNTKNAAQGDATKKAQGDSETLKVIQTLQNEVAALKGQMQKGADKTYQDEVTAKGAWLDNQITSNSAKYRLMNEDEVLTKIDAALARNVKVNEAYFERVCRESHERTLKAANGYQKARLKEQQTKAAKGLDSGAGGSAPGNSPNRPRNIADATEQAIKSLGSR